MKSHAPAHNLTAAASTPNSGFERTPLHLKATTATHAATGSSGGAIVRTLVALVIVIAVIWALTWVVRKVKGAGAGAGGRGSSGEGLERVATLALASNKSVTLIRVGSELHLLGVADAGVTGIRRFTEDEAVALGLPIVPPGADNAPRVRFVEDDDARPRPGISFTALKKLTQR